MNKDTPLIKLIIIKDKYYVYDAYTNRIICISSDIYVELYKLFSMGVNNYRNQKRDDRTFNDVLSLLNKGFFKPSFIKEIEHPDNKFLAAMTDRCINQIILGITNLCNFKCRYCHQAEGRVLSSKKMMSKETAKKSVDYLLDHSKDSFEVTITFYGGEPLLNFELIKTTVDYAESKFKTKLVSFNMTTNASLLNLEAADFLEKHNFSLLISLDGNERIQNSHRRYKENGNGTFESVWSNVDYIKEKYPDYFIEKVRFNSVVMQDENPEDVIAFFKERGVSETAVSVRRADMNGIDYNTSPLLIDDISNVMYFDDSIYNELFERLSDKSPLPEIWHHNGPCIPAVRRLFINADEELYPCEKVESDSSCLLGTLDSGIDIKKAKKILNIGKITEGECKECWALRFCTMCAQSCIDNGSLSKSRKLEKCKAQKSLATDFLQKYIIRSTVT